MMIKKMIAAFQLLLLLELQRLIMELSMKITNLMLQSLKKLQKAVR